MRSPRFAAYGWALLPLTVAAVHLGALWAAPALAAGVVSCAWPQAPVALPAWATTLAVLAAVAIALPWVDAAFSAAPGRPGHARRATVAAALTLALSLAALLTLDASLPSLALVMYAALVLVGESIRRWVLPLAPAPGARTRLQAQLAAFFDGAPYRAWLLAALFLFAMAALNYLVEREPNAERLANWSYGCLALGVGTGLLWEFVKHDRLPGWLRRLPAWLAPAALGVLLMVAGLVLERADQPPIVLRGAVDPLYARKAYADTARYLDQQAQPEDAVLTRDLSVGMRCYGLRHASLTELHPVGVEDQVARAFAGRRRVFLAYPVVATSNRRAERLALERNGDLIEYVPGFLALEVYAVRPPIDVVAGPALDANYGPLNAVSVALQPEVASGGVVGLSLQTNLNEQAGEDYLARLALLNESGQIVSSTDDYLLDPAGQHTGAWNVGQTVEDYLLLPVPLGSPPGVYRLALGFVSVNNPIGFPVLNRAGLVDNRLVAVGEVQVTRPADFSLDPYGTLAALKMTSINRTWGDIRLRAYRPVSGDILPGSALSLLLHWEALASAPAGPQRAQLRLAAGGDVVAQHEAALGGGYGPSQWQAGEQVLDWLNWPTPPEAPAGPATVQLSLNGTDWVDLGTITLGAITRSFEPPAVKQTAAARFGEVAELVGYAVTVPDAAGGPLGLTLHWRAANASPLRERYKVFVHALGPDGQILAQDDAEPATAARPTTSWVAGEYIADTHWVTLPTDYAGPVTWRIGLYDAETLARVPAAEGDFVVLPEAIIIPGP